MRAGMIDAVVAAMYSTGEHNRFLEVTYANGDKEILFFKDFASGAMIENVERRAKKEAIKRDRERDSGCADDRSRGRDQAGVPRARGSPLTPPTPTTGHASPGKKGERIVYVRTLIEGGGASRAIEAITTGQYL